jgi:hypothetical protein
LEVQDINGRTQYNQEETSEGKQSKLGSEKKKLSWKEILKKSQE